MAITNPTKRSRPAIQSAGYGPQIGFAGAALAAFAAAGAAVASLHPVLVMPLVATLLLGFAALFAIVAWRKGPTDAEDVTYWDVAGALMLIGLFASAAIEPDQLVRTILGDNR